MACRGYRIGYSVVRLAFRKAVCHPVSFSFWRSTADDGGRRRLTVVDGSRRLTVADGGSALVTGSSTSKRVPDSALPCGA